MMILLVLGIISSVLDWFSVLRNQKRLEFIFKPLTLILLILWFVSETPQNQGLLWVSFLIGLTFSLAGDVFLMFPSNQFILGLFAFLIAHVAYIVGFNSSGLVLTPTSIFILLIVWGISIVLFLRIRRGLQDSGRSVYIVPVALYVLVISLMGWSASTTLLRSDWLLEASLLTSIGALFFFISDSLLGWNRFVAPLPKGNVLVIMTYHLAQFLMSAGVILQLRS
jgi:uncharacterized membrane protein YhhN